jgi:hypothetical protein
MDDLVKRFSRSDDAKRRSGSGSRPDGDGNRVR